MVMTAKPWTLKTVRDRCTIDPHDEHSCWIWQQATTGRAKAPMACIEGRGGALVARWVMQHLGHKIDGLAVRQRCEERLCVNPGHLVLVTKGDVLRRAYATGSRSSESEYLSRLHRAQKSGMAKLTMPQALQLRQRMVEGGETIVALCDETGLYPSTLRAIKHGRSWRESQAAASVFTYRPTTSGEPPTKQVQR